MPPNRARYRREAERARRRQRKVVRVRAGQPDQLGQLGMVPAAYPVDQLLGLCTSRHQWGAERLLEQGPQCGHVGWPVARIRSGALTDYIPPRPGVGWWEQRHVGSGIPTGKEPGDHPPERVDVCGGGCVVRPVPRLGGGISLGAEQLAAGGQRPRRLAWRTTHQPPVGHHPPPTAGSARVGKGD